MRRSFQLLLSLPLPLSLIEVLIKGPSEKWNGKFSASPTWMCTVRWCAVSFRNFPKWMSYKFHSSYLILFTLALNYFPVSFYFTNKHTKCCCCCCCCAEELKCTTAHDCVSAYGVSECRCVCIKIILFKSQSDVNSILHNLFYHLNRERISSKFRTKISKKHRSWLCLFMTRQISTQTSRTKTLP